MGKKQRKRRFADAKIELYRILLLHRKRRQMVSTWGISISFKKPLTQHPEDARV